MSQPCPMTPTPEQHPAPHPDSALAPDPFAPPRPEQARAQRVHASLFRIAERHAATDEQRRRQVHPAVLGPHEAVRLVSFLLSGPRSVRTANWRWTGPTSPPR